MTNAQQRLLDGIRGHGGADSSGAEYWPVVNDWVKSGIGPELSLRNINRTVNAVLRDGHATLDDDGRFHLPSAEAVR